MATEYDMDNLTEVEADSNYKLPVGDLGGRIRHLRDEYTILAALANGDTLDSLTLPNGARVVDAWLHVDGSLGSSGRVTLGHRASDDAVESADADAFCSTCDAGGQAALTRMAAGQAALGKKFSAPVQVYIACTEASTETSNITIGYDIQYVLD